MTKNEVDEFCHKWHAKIHMNLSHFLSDRHSYYLSSSFFILMKQDEECSKYVNNLCGASFNLLFEGPSMIIIERYKFFNK